MGSDPTWRQAQILGLATAGLGDKEIASRLGLSERTVRSHFENFLRSRGLRNRSEAVASWLGRSSESSREASADECPYPKPFPAEFSECPAYQPTQFLSLDISHRPVGSFWTCRHLESRRHEGADRRWYGACALGDAQDRDQWSDALGADRLQEIGSLRQEISAISRPYVERLFEIQNQQVVTDTTAAGREMQLLADRFMYQMAVRLSERKPLLDRLNLPIDACLQLVRVAIDRFVEGGLPEAEWKVPDEVLNLFPEEVRPYFQPGYRPPTRSTTSRTEGAPRPD